MTKNKGGRPRKLHPDEETLKLAENLGRIQATTIECAHFFRVDEQTWLSFKSRFPEVQNAYDAGRADGKLSLRRKQLEEAMAGNGTMLVWLGKNILGQVDRQIQEHTGANGGPIQTVSLTNVSDEELAKLESILNRVSGAASGSAETGS